LKNDLPRGIEVENLLVAKNVGDGSGNSLVAGDNRSAVEVAENVRVADEGEGTFP
jgi:hypothetical protein